MKTSYSFSVHFAKIPPLPPTPELYCGYHILAVLSADVLRSKGRYGCHFTETTLSSCSSVLTTETCSKFTVSLMCTCES